MHPYMKARRWTVILDTATPLGPWEVDQQSVTDLSVLNLTTMLKRSRHLGLQPAQAGVVTGRVVSKVDLFHWTMSAMTSASLAYLSRFLRWRMLFVQLGCRR